MRIFLFACFFALSSASYAQQEYTQAEVEAYAAIYVESMEQIDAKKNDPPPGLDSAGITFERYGEIVRQGILGGPLNLSARDSAAMKVISAEVAEEEERRLIALLDKYGMSKERYRELDTLSRTDKEFSRAYRRAVVSFSQNRHK
jgi:hypothetical protein